MSIKKVFLYSFINGLLFSLPFVFDFLFFLIFFSFAMLFYFADKIKQNRKYIFLYLSVSVIVWQFITLSWFYGDSESPIWGITLLIVFSCLISLTFFGIFFCLVYPKNLKFTIKYSVFAILWISYEFLMLNRELRYPFHSLGIVVGNYPVLYQWYEFTGITGGSLWILLVNYTVIRIIGKERYAVASVIAIIPLICSIIIYFRPDKRGKDEIAVSVVNLKLKSENRFDETMKSVKNINNYELIVREHFIQNTEI